MPNRIGIIFILMVSACNNKVDQQSEVKTSSSSQDYAARAPIQYLKQDDGKIVSWGTAVSISKSSLATAKKGQEPSEEYGTLSSFVDSKTCLKAFGAQAQHILNRTNTDTMFAFRDECLSRGCFLIQAGEVYICRYRIFSEELSRFGLKLDDLLQK